MLRYFGRVCCDDRCARPQSGGVGLFGCFPTLCAIISDDNPTSILLGSSPTLYRGVAGIASAANNRVVMFLGNLEEGVVPFVLPDDAFGRLSNADGVNVTIDTNAHHAAYVALGNSSACALLAQLKHYLVTIFIPSYLYPISCY